MKPTELKGFREKIDAVDDQIVELLAERAGYVKEVGKRKKAAKLPEFRPEREVEIIERMCERNKLLNSGLPCESIATFWLEIISGCRALEKKLEIAYLGPQGTYSELAARVLFGHMVDLVPCDSLEEVLERGKGVSQIFLYCQLRILLRALLDAPLICLSQLRSRYQRKFLFL